MEKIIEVMELLNRIFERNQLTILVAVSALFVLLFLIVIGKFKKVPFTEGVLFIIPLLIVIFEFVSRYLGYRFYTIINNTVYTLKAVSTFLYTLAFVFSLIALFAQLAKKKDYKKVLGDVCIYYDLDEKFNYENSFYNCLTFLGKGKKKWKELCLAIYIDEKKVDIDSLEDEIRNINDNEFSIIARFNNNKEMHLLLSKKEVIKNGDLSGYALVKKEFDVCDIYKKETTKETIKNESGLPLNKYLETLNEAIGYLDNSISQYRLTRKMKEKLNLDSQTISYTELRNFVYFEDYVTFDAMKDQKAGSYKYRYRLKTNDGIEWYEEVRIIEGDNTISTFHKSSFEKSDTVIFSKDDLMRNLEDRINANEKFGLIFLFLEKGQTILRKAGKEAGNLVINNYFKKIQDKLLTDEDNVYRIGNTEYCILMSNLDNYQKLLNDVENGSSELLKASVNFDGNKYIIVNNLGFVYSEDLPEKNSLEYIEAGRLSLYFVSQNEENVKYNVYKVENTVNQDLDFEACKVDLDNSFLKDL